MAASSFLQSPEWEEFQRSLGRRTRRVNGALVIQRPLPMGLNYLYCPRPALGFRDKGLGIRTLDAIAEIAKSEKSVFLKIDPLHPLNPKPYTLYPSCPLQPQQTIILDLAKSEGELLAAMHEKTRYNIRLAERKGVRITNYGLRITDQEFRLFWDLLHETAMRDRFSTHPPEYYEKMLAVRSAHFSNQLFFTEYRGTILAAALINFYRSPMSQVPSSKFQVPTAGTATYLHGASSREYKEAMAPHLLHWRIIQEAKLRGWRCYDLWGIDEKRWPGLTRFKKGFGGAAATYPLSFDTVYRPAWYGAYRLWKRFLRR